MLFRSWRFSPWIEIAVTGIAYASQRGELCIVLQAKKTTVRMHDERETEEPP